MRNRALWSAVTAVSALAATAAVGLGVATPLRAVLVLWFVLVCPGMAVVTLLRIRDPLFVLVAAVTVSVALGVVVATALLYLGLWSPRVALGILAVLTVTLSWTAARGTDVVTGRDGG